MFRQQAGRQFSRLATQQARRTFATEASAEPRLKFEEKWPEYAALMTKEEIAAANKEFAAGQPYIFGKGNNLKPLFQDTSVNNYRLMYKPLDLKPGDLGNGNRTQREFNEHLYQLQQADPLKRPFGAQGIDSMNNEWFGTTNLMAIPPCVVGAWVGANMYRDMYLEKYNLWDMFLWESRVLCKEAKEARLAKQNE